MNALKALPLQQRLSLVLLFTSALFFWTSMTSLLPTLPLYIEEVGGTPQQIGIVMGGFAIGLLFSRTWLGQLADNRSRKLVILIGAFVAASAPLGYLFLGKSLVSLFALRAFHGISIAAFTTGYSALVVDLAPLKQRGEIIGYMSLAVPLGMGAGPAVGGWIQETWGFTELFLLSAFFGGISTLLALQLSENPRQTLESSPIHLPPPARSFRKLFQQQALLVPAVILLLIGLLFGTLATFLPLFIREIGLPVNIGLFYSLAAIASFISRFFVGKASDRYGRGIFITGSLLCYVLSMILLTTLSRREGFFLAAVLEGTGAGILIPMLIALISDRSYDNERGKVYAICIGGFDVGIALAGPVIGGLSALMGYRGMFLLTGHFAFLALILFLTLSSKTLQTSWRFALGKAQDNYAIK